MKDNQDKLLKMIKDPKVIAKAVEGSMDVRARRMEMEELNEIFEACHLNGIGQGGLTSRQAKAEIQALILKRETQARIDELRSVWGKFTDIQFNGTNGPQDNPDARKYIDERLAQLRLLSEENNGMGTVPYNPKGGA